MSNEKDTSMLSPIVVTGATGYIGSHVVAQLLEAGYTVRAVIRIGKSVPFRATHPTGGERLLVEEITDIATSDLSGCFKDAQAIIHVAAAISTGASGTPESIIQSAIDGTRNVMDAAVKCGVKKVVLTSSFSALFDPDMKKAFQSDTIDETSWSSATLDQIPTITNIDVAYVSAKPLAEKLAWEIAEKEGIDLITILPSLVYGPFLPNWPAPSSLSSLGSIVHIYTLICSEGYPRMGFTHFVDVRDVARAHVLSLSPLPSSSPSIGNRKKRMILVADRFMWPQAAEYLLEKRKDLVEKYGLKKNLDKGGGEDKGPKNVSRCGVDMKVVKDLIGMVPNNSVFEEDEGKGNMIGWEKSLEDSVESLLAWEREREREN